MMDVIYAFLTALLGGLVGKILERRKNHAEIKSTEIDNAVKNANYYQSLLDDMVRRHKEILEELDRAVSTIQEKDKQIKEMMEVITDLTDELKKYKQLNGKS